MFEISASQRSSIMTDAASMLGGLHWYLSHLKREAGEDPRIAGGEVRADDHERSGIQRIAKVSLIHGEQFNLREEYIGSG